MEFPVWFIPGISKGVLIGVVSVLHVFVSQFAVGGGIYLVWMEKKAHASAEPLKSELLDWLHKHTSFFLLLTMVFGGLSGVAIWFTMAVTNPAATSALIHIFLWIWAAEWVFFLVEIVALLVYYYTYPLMRSGQVTVKVHLWLGYIYAVSAYMSLVLINGVICFMLTPGEALENNSLASAYFNPTFWPSLFFRTALCLMLAGIFALFTSTRVKNAEVRYSLVKSNALWVCIPFIFLAVSSLWYFFALPIDRQAAVFRRTADIRPFLITYGWILPIIFLLGVLSFVKAEKFRLALSVLILCSGLTLVCSFEMMRETARRPWILPGFMYSSTVRVAQAKEINEQGIAFHSGWLKVLESRAEKPGLDFKTAAEIKTVAAHNSSSVLQKGEFIFAQQCGTCHAVGGARLNILPKLERFTLEGLAAQIAGQGIAPLDYMPPFHGDKNDLNALAGYLNDLKNLDR